MTRNDLIANGVDNLKEFGYPGVSADNILTDQIYKMFFRSMLVDTLDLRPSLGPIVAELLDEIDGKKS